MIDDVKLIEDFVGKRIKKELLNELLEPLLFLIFISG